MIIYQAINKINAKTYIGQTLCTLEKRKKVHIYASNNRSMLIFHKALRKYGINNFTWSKITSCNSIEELNKMEIFYISILETNNNKYGYNMTSGGESVMRGRKHTKETLEKMSLSHRGLRLGKKHSIETKLKISNTNKGVSWGKHSEEAKNKMSLSKIGINNPNYKSGKNHPLYGKHHSIEAKKKMSLSRIAYIKKQKKLELKGAQNG
jgi:group I intron endonuclease